MPEARRWWAPWGWTGDGAQAGWQRGVLLQAGADGCFERVDTGVAPPPEGAATLPGPVLPGLVDAHSHAFQRAFAGLAERREGDADDFWGWRDRMYRVALRITPAQLQAVAAQLYAELLRGGYTQVCEFHYLQHATDGRPYDDPLAMAWALADAAQQAGIGLTLLPVLYERAGFTQPALRADQRRFATDPPWVWRACQAVNAARRPLLNAGVALHSLRAAAPASIRTLLGQLGGQALPVHIHVAEQVQEVDDCLAHCGRRPIEWLAAEGLLDRRWQLVHATHTVPAEIEAVARSGAGIVICPGTEANLGDGFADLPAWLAAGVPMAVGSDSQVTRAWPEELRWLEGGQRLRLRQRNVAADPQRGQPASAARLFEAARAAGAAAAGLPSTGLQAGARADWLVLDSSDDALLGLPPSHWLDGLVFSAPSPAAIREVWVAGRRVVQDGRHVHDTALRASFAEAMSILHRET